MAGYEHSQRGRLHLILMGVAALIVALTFTIDRGGDDVAVRATLLVVSALFLLLAAAFTRLTVTEHDDHLRVAFGPLPLAARKVVFEDVRSAKASRSSFIDGWGIHWVPGRGWTWNVWGFDCVELELDGGRTLRIGTDDAERLAEVIRARSGLVSG